LGREGDVFGHQPWFELWLGETKSLGKVSSYSESLGAHNLRPTAVGNLDWIKE
jgi:hypothetical protein